MLKEKKVAAIEKQCVACGSCLKICPLNAISVFKGMYAVVDTKKCVGCGKCANTCPASVIEIIQKGGIKNEAEALV